MPYHIKELSAAESVAIFKALASESRVRILELLADRDMNINELSAALGLAQPSTSKHVQILEESGLVVSDYMAGPQGMQKRCRRVHERLVVEMAGKGAIQEGVGEVEVPVGMFTNVSAVSTCGLASREKFIGLIDSPLSFFMPERATAEILWSSGGFVEYMFANTLPLNATVTAIDLAMEVSSEAPGYNNTYPSDLTLWINDVEVGTWCSPGDYGGTRGRLNPHWWPDNMNQSGILKVWQVDQAGSTIDGVPLSAVTVNQLSIEPWQATRVRLGIKADSPHQGGFTIFGRGFGNYELDLVLRIRHKTSEGTRPEPGANSLGE
jgi:predicted transcriptional regulator